MDDPFSALLNSIQPVFQLEAMRNGKYTYPAVQKLKEATEHYDPTANNTFNQLLKSLEKAMPHIEKWRVDFSPIKSAMDDLAKRHQMPPIDWNKVLSNPKVSSRFQFIALNFSSSEIDLNAWISNQAGKPMVQLEPFELTQELVKNIDIYGFSQQLRTYLDKYPDFLFHLIMESETLFRKICSSRLVLFLTDQQIAKAIVQHTPGFVQKSDDPFNQVKELVETFNDILSNGRSISTVLRNAEAIPILFNSIYFQLYQSEEYNNRQSQTSASASTSASDHYLETKEFKPEI